MTIDERLDELEKRIRELEDWKASQAPTGSTKAVFSLSGRAFAQCILDDIREGRQRVVETNLAEFCREQAPEP